MLELIGCRYADPTSATFLEMLADGLNNQGLFVGPEVGDGAIRPLETIRVTVASATETILTHEGRHGDGHPLRPLVWLANFFASRDQGLEAGQIVTTGSYAGVLELPLATPLEIRIRRPWHAVGSVHWNGIEPRPNVGRDDRFEPQNSHSPVRLFAGHCLTT